MDFIKTSSWRGGLTALVPHIGVGAPDLQIKVL
nr:MAG TPA: hypothetical protein [Caudoviricetes sp.]DAV50872.1 MAG TPA: hypothetical protein [Caudoviricetes sp.]